MEFVAPILYESQGIDDVSSNIFVLSFSNVWRERRGAQE